MGKKGLKMKEKGKKKPETQGPLTPAGPGECQANLESGGEVSRLSLRQALFLTAVWISLQNTGSHGNLNLIHKSQAPIQSNLIPSLGQGSSGPPTPHPYQHPHQHGYHSVFEYPCKLKGFYFLFAAERFEIFHFKTSLKFSISKRPSGTEINR